MIDFMTNCTYVCPTALTFPLPQDKKNPMLRMRLLAGILSAEKLSKMTSEEMANEDIKKQREAFVKEGINESRLAQVEVSTIDV